LAAIDFPVPGPPDKRTMLLYGMPPYNISSNPGINVLTLAITIVLMTLFNLIILLYIPFVN
jgi:hypothetical protein